MLFIYPVKKIYALIMICKVFFSTRFTNLSLGCKFFILKSLCYKKVYQYTIHEFKNYQKNAMLDMLL